MKTVIISVVSILLGLLIGALSALHMAGLIGGSQGFGRGQMSAQIISINGWHSDWTTGSSGANPYTRARIARHGLLALTKSEAVYFTTNVDSEGQGLTDHCAYSVIGTGQDAQWWSITLYDDTGYLANNDDKAASINAEMMDVSGEWHAMIAPQKPNADGLWISSRDAGEFDLTLRLYKPSPAILKTPAIAVAAPVITRLSCDAIAS